MAGRARLRFARGLVLEFRDREKALRRFEILAERGTYPVYIVYGPEGCGRTALLLQAKTILEEDYGYHVVYVNPLAGEIGAIAYTPSVSSIVREVLGALPEPYSRIIDAALEAAALILRRLRRPRLAVLLDDVFQAVGVETAEGYVKMLLNLIKYPPGDYERIFVMVASGEGLAREDREAQLGACKATLEHVEKRVQGAVRGYTQG